MVLCTPRQNLWVLDNASDVHVCNNKESMLTYTEESSAMTGATAIGTSPGKGTSHLKLAQKDGSPGSKLNLSRVWYIPECPVNLISQARLNDSGIHYNDETWELYVKDTREIVGYVPRVNNNYVFRTLDNMDNPNMEIYLTRIDDNTYQGPKIQYTRSKDPLSVWHARLGHLNIASCRNYLEDLQIIYEDDWDSGRPCEACELGKATKSYNRTPQAKASETFQCIHTDLIGKIKPEGLLQEKYVFTFTDDRTRFTHSFTGKNKHEWFEHLQCYYSLAQSKSQKPKPVLRLRTDYGTELRSSKADDWMLSQGITFEPSAPYSQEENGVSERVGRILMDMTRCTILGGNIPDYLWPEVFLAMTHIKNIRPTAALTGKSPHELYEEEKPSIDHLRVLGSTVYVFIHEEERLCGRVGSISLIKKPNPRPD